AVRRQHLEAHTVQVNRMLVLAEVTQLENVMTIFLQRRDGPLDAALVVNVPGLPVDLPEAVGGTLFDTHRHRARPLEVEAQLLGAGQVRLGNGIGRQWWRPNPCGFAVRDSL